MDGNISIYYKGDISKKEDIKFKIKGSVNNTRLSSRIEYKDEEKTFDFERFNVIDAIYGNKPFEKDGKVIVFNGNIYNYHEIKEELIKKGHNFTTNDDIEVLLASYIEFGKNCVHKIKGMFNFIIYDRENESIFGARDLFGIKPLYYINKENAIIFSSEYKFLLEYMKNLNINERSLQSYFSFQYVLPEDTMIQGIRLIPAGHYFRVENGILSLKRYNKLEFRSSTKFFYTKNHLGNRDVNEDDIRNIVVDSIVTHMEEEKEIGTFLSGGIDSSIITTVASQINPNIKSFSAGFSVKGYSELEVAKKTADKLGIENIQINITQDEYIKSLPNVIYSLDDPIADPSEVGLYFLIKEAGKHVKVVLSGEGADELFGGYNIYKEYSTMKSVVNSPTYIKSILGRVSELMPNIKGRNYLYRATTPLEKRYIGNAKVFENSEVKRFFFKYKEKNIYEYLLSNLYRDAQKNNYDYISKMQHIDVNTWLQGDILQKISKLSTAEQVELRVPFLYKDVFDVAKNLRMEQKINKNNTKVLLREAFREIVPEHVVQRKKLGFPTPIRVWLKDSLGDIVKETIYNSNVDEFIDKKYAIKLLDTHLKGHRDNSRKIWTIFTFCLWHQLFIEHKNVEY
ncbi:asparagine synthase (glutamine-hydrolyzing) [Clostridioides difficile]|uniref:asparagine synthase (glutamine-hydrolyzing) n=2 Tax=Clostridioides difficile TaxID=1496 RepID=UPI000F609BAA|nr:asparagine synthase (glutamine-hydrolyzing) [Clostridioides difficile]MCJ0308974.1 asparagine synthase (glutamine-hydrolyzing) [Clostridioides difficile]MCJ0376484.1 asparagine synthase (glutamine-hydrolyzing) [Clostridioides difficile]MCJ0411049.1 asparagine synthase (glutamine-hydrolyzing) [Clostridioides difficile]MCO8701158.1 asparagine synthase (glutamine-hydrolyzing) [Clostridioides difficile]MDB0414537.1 asparagine synthase (glutamine-hydrolyzing) [Clostridioides difficile]